MIKNSRQYGVANRQITKLQEALELSKNYPIEMDQRLYEAMIAGIESQIQDIQKEIEEYDKLQKVKHFPSDTLDNIGKFLIKARIACGYTQEQLAKKVGIKSQQIQQYEASEYKSINLKQLKKIITSLEVNAMFEFGATEECFPEYTTKDWDMVKTEMVSDVQMQEATDSLDWLSSNEIAVSQWNIEKAA